MSIRCAKCAAPMEPTWSFCPRCGAVNLEAAWHKAEPRKHEPSPVRNAFGGLFIGVIIASPCIIVGGMLCCTILGAVLGIPLIILGILAPLLGPILGFNKLEGSCPWCGARINSLFNHTQDFPCPACGEEICIQDRELKRAA